MKKSYMKKLAAVAAAVMVITSAGCSDATGSSEKNTVTTTKTNSAQNANTEIKADDLDVGYEETDSTLITFSEQSAEISGEGASADGTTVTLSNAGTYILSGSCDNGRIIVNTAKDAEVKLVFKGLSLTCTDNAPVLISNADKAYIILEDGTENVITDGASYNTDENENTDGAIFSKADLTINGGGKLTVNANYKHGIVSKDDLVITGGEISVNSASTALEGKDSVKISDGDFNITAGSNAIRSTNAEDEGKGFISISGGKFTITAGGDGIDAETLLTVDGGEFDITTGGGSENASMKADGTPNGNWQKDMHGGFDKGGMGGMVPPDDMGGAQPASYSDVGLVVENAANTQTLSVDQTAAETETADSSSSSAKALKCGGNIEINGGDITVDSADDSLHCGGDLTITGGTINASSGDDGIHSDANVLINGGDITIAKSYEGIEGLTVTISDGDIKVTSSDDGINCAGGSDTGSNDRAGMDPFAAQEGTFLNITGGTLYVNASGDGLDSNGNLYMEGGTVYVSGPENSGNGALDYNGTAEITGGTIVASGAAGMEECFGDTSTQYAVLHDFTSSFSANTQFTVTDSAGNEILSFTNEKTWQGVVFSSPELKEGETYTLTAGSASDTVTIDSIITSNSTGGFGGGRGGLGGRGF